MRKVYKKLSLEQIRSFQEVCRLGSYAEAARRLELAPSTVWEQSRGLERQFELSLLESHNGVVRATAAGEELLHQLGPLLAGLESAREGLRQKHGYLPREITLVSGIRMLTEEVGQAVPRFQGCYPSVRLRLLHEEDRAIESSVECGAADMGLMLEPGPGRPPRTALTYEWAYTLDYLLVMPAKHPLARLRPLRLKDIARYPLIVGEAGTSSRRRIDEVFHQHHLLEKLNLAVETSSAVMTFAYVRSGAGLGITAGHLRSFLSEALAIRSLRRWFGSARYAFVWPRGATIPPVERELAEAIRSSVTGR